MGEPSNAVGIAYSSYGIWYSKLELRVLMVRDG